jgi:predicted ABC-type ATPase
LVSGVSFNQETTLSGKTIFNTIQQAKELGYTIHLRYVGVATPDIAKKRVEDRIARGGHGVSEGTIERRFNTSKDNFLKIYPFCDSIIIYDNTEQMTCVASIQNGELTTIQEVPWVKELLESVN